MGSLAADATRGRILFVDAYDSFSNNIVGLLQECLEVDVTLVHMDDENVGQNLHEMLSTFDAVVVGPGPGHPAIPSDVGFITRLWDLDDAQLIPILGICLGFQSLSYAHGAQVKRLRRARHGIVGPVSHNDTDIFAGIGELNATQYHSLHVDIGSREDYDMVLRRPSTPCPSLQPLAWDLEDAKNGPILMGVRHTTKPFWGVQFHPESICTSEAGKRMVQNWWAEARKWSSWPRLRDRRPESVQAQGPIEVGDAASPPPRESFRAPNLAQELRSVLGGEDILVRWGRHRAAASITATGLVEALGYTRNEVVLLDSQEHARGRFSILGLVVPSKTMKVTYSVWNRTLRYGIDEMSSLALESIDEVWPILKEALDMHDPCKHNVSSGEKVHTSFPPPGLDSYVAGHCPTDSPFWGGFMGYISYEAGLETIDVDLPASNRQSSVPDINFVFIHRSIVIDHETSEVYIQSLLPRDWEWILSTGRVVETLATGNETVPCSGMQSIPSLKDEEAKKQSDRAILDQMLASAQVSRPQEALYRSKVLRCQESLASGDSYELCLTDETQIVIPTNCDRRRLDAWQLYKKLRRNNPAPFGAFLRLSDVIVASSSPERFLSWTRNGRCQFRPIKGTVYKSPSMSRELAHEILGSSKERAENLMIVDLIRHDLSGVVGAGNTWVTKLMVVEEYQTVYQLVSVIEGQLPDAKTEDGLRASGIDVLRASLPPGSMTGAPKKRSCEILSEIEQRPRGVYSGVLGYLDIGGGGDFSVVIRTAVRDCDNTDAAGRCTDNGVRDSDGCSNGRNGHFETSETWRVGAGGAVTIQSTDEGEFEEMQVKASSVLGALLT
ncbi:para-aminobenzoate synthase [Xylariaceae sp. FL1272]|nr:para-aminobenzoate synthase [Xylariaceae sp. FL1272]